MSLQIPTPQTITEPVTLDAVKAVLKLTSTLDDDTITANITAAREYAESVTGWSLAAKSYLYTRDRFPKPCEAIELLRPPLVAVQSIQYLDDTYTWQTWDPSQYWVAAANAPAKIVPIQGVGYPCPVNAPGAVQIAYTAGAKNYAPHLQGIIQLAVHLYSHPEVISSEMMREMPMAITAFFRVKKVQGFV